MADFNGPAALTSSTVKNYEYTPSTPVTLEMSTEYWVVVDQGGAGVSVQFTASDSEDGTPVDGASIGNAAHSRTASSAGSFSQHSGTTPSLMIKVNGSTRPTTPTVCAVAITSDPGMDITYATGDTVTLNLTFSEAVTVTDTPHVVVDIGVQPRNFKYSVDGSSAAAQPFSYTVIVGDRDLDGVSLQIYSFTLNGGTIQATDDSTNATLTHAAMTFANHKVDTEVTLLSNLGQGDASDTITISATESARVEIRVAADKYPDINASTLYVRTPSDTLEVTVRLFDHEDGGGSANYTYSRVRDGRRLADAYIEWTIRGAIWQHWRSVFCTYTNPFYRNSRFGHWQQSNFWGPKLYLLTLVVCQGYGIISRTAWASFPQMRLSGHERFNSAPHIRRRRFESAEWERLCCRRPDRHAVRVLTRPMDYPEGLTVPIWLGDRRRAPPRGTPGHRSFRSTVEFSRSFRTRSSPAIGIRTGYTSGRTRWETMRASTSMHAEHPRCSRLPRGLRPTSLR